MSNLPERLVAEEEGAPAEDALVQLQDVPTAFVQRSPSPAPR